LAVATNTRNRFDGFFGVIRTLLQNVDSSHCQHQTDSRREGNLRNNYYYVGTSYPQRLLYDSSIKYLLSLFNKASFPQKEKMQVCKEMSDVPALEQAGSR
jgi:hypothetical protein